MPHYDRHTDLAGADEVSPNSLGSGADEAAMEVAAESLREAEVEAVQPASPARDPSTVNPADLEQMNIDDLRVLAKELDVKDRAAITEKDDLVAAIRQCL